MTAIGSAWGGLNQPAPARRRRSVTGAVPKRAVDVVGVVALALLLWPVLLVAALAILATSPGPVLFRQPRIGRHGRSFTMLKLRTMHVGAPDTVHRDYVRSLLTGQAVAVGGLYKLQGDSRITKVGAFLRRTSIDELPQLWNVLRGQMSLVGPRPALEWEVELFPAWARRRFEVRPGVTGLWQVSGRNRLTMLEGLALDVRYVDARTLLLDLLILLRTVRAVVGRGAR
jgi:lipopolysaccharide/colanic/teichoic acid biosynthesis glycosyltransferase